MCIGLVWYLVSHSVKMCRHNVGIQDVIGGHTHTSCIAGLCDRCPHQRCLGKVSPNQDGLGSRSSKTELSLVTA